MTNSHHRYVLKLSCPDRVGIVAAVAGFHAEHGASILRADHHHDADTGRFFMRQEVDADALGQDAQAVRDGFAPIAERFDMDWRINDTAKKKRVVLLCSKQDHCLNDLLYRWRSGDMDFDLAGVISNHEDVRSFVEWHDVPFHHVPVDRHDKEPAFREVDRLFEAMKGDAMVLARYMQILPEWMCEKHPGRIINIHHSFLPSFVGARPYHQAHERGVKFVGATCHYVTADLDEGPIIEQDAVRTGHAHSVEELIRLGRDVEAAVLARGLRYHLEDRVSIQGRRTVVFA